MTWLFGYGSLVWRPGFRFVEAHPARVEGWLRRFWQASPDHRGTPDAPGRVATLLPSEGAHCWGRVYKLAREERERVLAALDRREQAGYTHHWLEASLPDGTVLGDVLVYVATPDNPNFLGPASLEAMVRQVLHSEGPSGSNRDYVLQLAEALGAMGVRDPHVCELAEALASGEEGAAG